MESNEIKKRIPEQSAFVVKMPAKLEGSDKQVEWADQIRKKVLKTLGIYTVNRLSNGDPCFGMWETAKKGEEAVVENILNSPLVTSTEGSLRQEKIENHISAYKDMAERIKRLESITQKTSAAWWIENKNIDFERIVDGK